VVAGTCLGSAMTAAGNHKRMLKQWLQLQFFELLMMSGVSLETC
jgi:hypothetical protein